MAWLNLGSNPIAISVIIILLVLVIIYFHLRAKQSTRESKEVGSVR